MQQARPFLSRLARDTAGNTLALAAAAIIPFTILVGSGLDLSVTYMARGKLQNACDAGVLAARQFMEGTEFNDDVRDEAQRFFDFNFPAGTAGAFDVEFAVNQDTADRSQLLGTASASIPTSLMRVVGFTELDIAVNCNATRDMGHNDITLVLDVTGSMNCPPGVPGGCGGVEQVGSKIGRLREGTLGLYRALESGDGSITRYAIVPYSHAVNVGRSLDNRDILVNQQHVAGQWRRRQRNNNGSWGAWQPQPSYAPDPNRAEQWSFVQANPGERTVHISNSSWNNGQGGGAEGNRLGFRTSGNACIEERPTVGTEEDEFRIEDYVTADDIEDRAANGNDTMMQFGRYDPAVQLGHTQFGCPSEATMFDTYDDVDAFEAAINTATARVTGGTYHDVGMLWGARFASRTFLAENGSNNPVPTDWEGIPINLHIVFMTDGMLDTGNTLYSAHGVEQYQNRTRGSGSLDDKHIARFHSACDVAKEMEITIWVIALDVTDTTDIEPCETSGEHFYTSDGSDLEEIFEKIGRGIGNLRLTR